MVRLRLKLLLQKKSETYLFFKHEIGSIFLREQEEIDKNNQGPKLRGVVALSSCATSANYIGFDRSNKIIANLAELAYDVLYMKVELKRAGYPTRVWMRDLVRFERDALIGINGHPYGVDFSAKKVLAKKLNNYRRKLNKAFSRIVPGVYECGSGEVQVVINVSPFARRVRYINLIKYKLCAFQGIDPLGGRCDLWTDYSSVPKEGVLMSGKYKVRALWSDGTVALRDLNVDDLIQGRDGVYYFAINK